MKLFIASDHGGYQLKEILKEHLKDKKYDLVDLGTDSEESVDYPDYVKKLCKAILKDSNSKGIAICGTGLGTSISANKFKGIRAAACTNSYMARMSRVDNDANILCFGERVIGDELAKNIVDTWLETEFSNSERHVRRISKIE